MTMGDHFGRVAAVYESLRTTDEAPVRAIGQFLTDRPVTGLDAGCGTGRYSRLLGELLPDGSLLAATDASAAMLAQLTAGTRGHAPGVVPLLAAAGDLPLRAASLDLVTAFNCVHHFDLGRFLTAVARVLRPGGQLFIYTRTPQQNARTIWGRYFPGFHRARAAAVQPGRAAGCRQADRRAHGGRSTDLPAAALEHRRTPQGPGRGTPLLDVLPLPAAGAERVHRDLPGPPARPRGLLGRRAPSWSSPAPAAPARPSLTVRPARRASRSRITPPDPRRAPAEAPKRHPGGRAQITPLCAQWIAGQHRQQSAQIEASRILAPFGRARVPADVFRCGGC